MGVAFYSPAYALPFDDDFTGINGSLPNTDRWVLATDKPTNSYQIYDNKLRLHVSGGGGISLGNTITFDGDFDVQVDWTKVIGPNTNNWSGIFAAVIIDGPNAGWKAQMSRLYSLNQAIRYAKFAPSQVYNQFNTAANVGKFRLTRIDGFIQGYHDVGSGWVSQYPSRFFTDYNTVEIRLGMASGEFDPSATFDFDNLISV